MVNKLLFSSWYMYMYLEIVKAKLRHCHPVQKFGCTLALFISRVVYAQKINELFKSCSSYLVNYSNNTFSQQKFQDRYSCDSIVQEWVCIIQWHVYPKYLYSVLSYCKFVIYWVGVKTEFRYSVITILIYWVGARFYKNHNMSFCKFSKNAHLENLQWTILYHNFNLLGVCKIKIKHYDFLWIFIYIYICTLMKQKFVFKKTCFTELNSLMLN